MGVYSASGKVMDTEQTSCQTSSHADIVATHQVADAVVLKEKNLFAVPQQGTIGDPVALHRVMCFVSRHPLRWLSQNATPERSHAPIWFVRIHHHRPSQFLRQRRGTAWTGAGQHPRLMAPLP